jgi:ribonucleoside-diphosphate reductase alpha chain
MGERIVKDTMSTFSQTIMNQKYAHDLKDGGKETWDNISYRVGTTVLKSVGAPKSLIDQTVEYIKQRKFIPGGRYLYATKRPYHQVQNCILNRAEDSREGWAEHMSKCAMALMTGAGIGIAYGEVRAEGKPIRKTGGTATGPLALMQMTNEAGRGIMQGGSRRSAIWAGLPWWHADIMKFIRMKDWLPEVRALKEKDFNFPATMDGTNISVQLDDEFFAAYHDEKHTLHGTAHMVYWAVVERMLKTAEPGFSIDCGKNSKEVLRNACTEVTSADDSDVCNLGSLNLARIESLEEMAAVLECATAFLLAGTVYSDVPYPKIDQVRTKNRRLGLGLMGIHEWLLLNGKKYGADPDLDKYLEVYATSTKVAHDYAKKWDLSSPVKTRAIAPTGTIGIIAETTTGIEPIFCSAFKRRYLKGGTWNFQYVIDPTAKRLIEDKSVASEQIEDAYELAEDVERRVAFQAHVQRYVDHAISSTINLPEWGSELNNRDTVQKFGRMLIGYLPNLRGVTCYPDGARGGQPLTPVKYSTAAKHIGEIFVESVDICDITKGGTCGS